MFFVSGRYKEQLKLLYKVHKVFCRKVFFEHRDTETLRFFRVRKIQRAAKAAFTEDTELSAAMQVPLGGLGGLGAFSAAMALCPPSLATTSINTTNLFLS